MAKSKMIDPLGNKGQTPDWGVTGGYACVDFYGDQPVMILGEPGYYEHEKPAPSEQPRKSNPGGPMRYFSRE